MLYSEKLSCHAANDDEEMIDVGNVTLSTMRQRGRFLLENFLRHINILINSLKKVTEA